ncbi:sugar kinase [Achromatium sp. WMS2]|nr:sugar kinase [Achromatium sp. WMS2]
MIQSQGESKIVLVIRKTRLQELIQRFNTEQQAQFYIEHLGADFFDYQREHVQYQEQLQQTQTILNRLGRLQLLERGFISNYVFGPADIIVVLGQDGLVANTLKYLNGQPVIGLNPDRTRWEGVLLPFTAVDLPRLIPEVIANKRSWQELTMAEVQLNDGQNLQAVNDFFIGPRSHTSAMYRIEINSQAEEHLSSGIIVSTGLGSTGWLRSILTGAAGIVQSVTNIDVALDTRPMPWNSEQLVFSVREPWPSRTSAATITFGQITSNNPLRIISHMPEHGVIFSDGIETDYLAFNSGSQATIKPASQKGRLVV